MSFKVDKLTLHRPNNEEVARIIRDELKLNYLHVSCEVVDCPDLTKPPWELAMEGLCGSPCIGEIGGVTNVCPIARPQKIYDIRQVAKLIGYDNGLLIGAGAGPHPYVGKNSEMIPNLRFGSQLNNASRIVKTSDDDRECIVAKLPTDETRCALLLNFLICNGVKGPVLRVLAKKRIGQDNFIGCMRKALSDQYKMKIVGLGGTFLLKKGTAKIHVMPDFSKTPLNTLNETNSWLKFFDMKGPMRFMSTFASRDPGNGYRVEHSHGYNETEGGHYHYDITPDEVEYEGYFSVADFLYRIDAPPNNFL